MSQEAQKTDDLVETMKTTAEMAIPDAPAAEVDDLPESVRKQLIGYGEIELKTQLADCVSAIATLATVDKIIVALYKRHKRADLDRAKIIRVLNLMVAEGALVKNNSPRGYRMASAANG